MRRGFDTDEVAAVGAGVSLVSNLGAALLLPDAVPERGFARHFRWVLAAAAAAGVVDIVRMRRYRRGWIVLGSTLSATSNLIAARSSDRGAANLAYHQTMALAVGTSVTEGLSPFGLAVLGLAIGGTFLSSSVQRKSGAEQVPLLPPTLDLAAAALGLALATDRLRRLDAEVTELEGRAREHAAAAALDAEHTRQHRMLHDTVLQTLEAVSGDWHATDDQLRRLAEADATRLRRVIAGEDTAVTLAAGLTELARLYRDLGLRVNMDLATLTEPSDAAATVAVTAATREALQNVLKHAGPCRVAILTDAGPDSTTVTIRDDGAGFDPSVTPEGFGLGESIRARMASVSGSTEVDSTPGRGTVVRLRIPATG